MSTSGNGCACPRNYKECIEQAAESAATKAEELARGIAYAASREAEEAKRLAEEAASKTKGLVGSALEKAKDAAAKAKEAAERLQATALDSLEVHCLIAPTPSPTLFSPSPAPAISGVITVFTVTINLFTQYELHSEKYVPAGTS